MWRFLRGILLKNGGISTEMAVEIARKHCSDTGAPFEEPIHISNSLFKINIMTNSRFTGGNVFMSIDIRDGSIAHYFYADH